MKEKPIKNSLKKRSIVTHLLALCFILGACSPPVDTGTKEKEIEKQPNETVLEGEVDGVTSLEVITALKEENAIQKKKLDKQEEEKLYYKDYVRKVVLQLSDEKLAEIIDNEWEYQLTVNGVNFPADGLLEISATNLELVISERRVPFSVLNEEESMKGKLDRSLESMFSISDNDIDRIIEKDEDGLSAKMQYNFVDLEKGTKYEIKIDELLQKKLKLTKTDLTLLIK